MNDFRGSKTTISETYFSIILEREVSRLALLFARVQLSGDPTREQYESLHSKMAGIGFSIRITTANGTWELPHATYAGTAYANANMASDAVKKTADSVVANSRVLVSSGADWQANGLKKIQ